MKIKIKRTHPLAQTPAYATPGAACFDLRAIVDGGPVTIQPGKATAFDTGIAFELPENHVLLIHSRSGHGFKSGVRLANVVGILDFDFRDSAKVKLHNDSDVPFTVTHGDRIAQAMVLPFPKIEFEEVGELSVTKRGLGGLGSTGSA